MQYLFLWASGAPNSRVAPGSPHSSYATAYQHQSGCTHHETTSWSNVTTDTHANGALLFCWWRMRVNTLQALSGRHAHWLQNTTLTCRILFSFVTYLTIQAIWSARATSGLLLLQPLRWYCVDCVIHHERDVREEQKYISVARESNNKRDCDAWSLLSLAAAMRSFAHMPLGISIATLPHMTAKYLASRTSWRIRDFTLFSRRKIWSHWIVGKR